MSNNILSPASLEGIELKPFRTFPSCSNRRAWKEAAEMPDIRAFLAEIIRSADAFAGQPVPALSAVRYMDFVRCGDRKKFEDQYFDRRRHLAVLTLAECFTGKGTYLDAIAEYFCALEGEYTWCLPAHVHSGEDALPFLDHETVDLFSAETSCQLAVTLELLEPELAKLSANLVRRMKKILYDRSVGAVESGVIDDYFWMTGRNNWTPWVISNMLWCANYLFKEDGAHLTAFARLLLPGLERYYNRFPEDGCCNEGPGYWGHASLRYLLDAEFFFRASEGRINVFKDAKTRRMGEYICGPWIHRNCFVPFGDSNLKISHQYGILRMAGARLNSLPMQQLAADAQEASGCILAQRPCSLFAACADLFTPRTAWEDGEKEKNKAVFFPKTEQFFCRRGKQFFAVKGGCNAESHNHLDVGQFFFVSGDDHIVIDPGSTVYDRTTFSSARYAQWCRNSTGHNPMLFDGIGQELGAEARTGAFTVDGTGVCMELAPAYKAETALTAYRRELHFDGSVLTLRDSFTARKPVKPQMRIYSLLPQLPLRERIAVKTEKIAVTDEHLLGSWGDTLYLHCIDLPESEKGEISLTFDPALIKR